MRRADLAALAALLACASLAAAARAPGSDACVLLRLRDRNMAYIERTAEAAAGLSGPRAGAYLRAEDVAALAGRSESELAELADVLRQLGGRLQAMGQLRDLAVACFPAAAIPGLAAASASASASQSALQRELAAATQRVIDAQRAACAAPSAEAAFAAEALVLALPPKVAGIISFIQPLSRTQPDVPTAATSYPQRRLLAAGAGGSTSQQHKRGPAEAEPGVPLQPARFGGSGTAAPAAASLPAWQAIKGSFSADVPSGYGPPLPAALGQWNGWADSATGTAWGVPQFGPRTLMGFLGVRDRATILNNINTASVAFAAMLPCQLQLGPGNTVTGVTYATKATAAACAAQFSVTFGVAYAGAPKPSPPQQSAIVPPSAVSVLSCGEAVARSQGQLPAGTCASIGQQLAAQAKLSALIGDDTAIYAALPRYVGLLNVTVTATLASSVPAVYRSFGLLAYASTARPFSVAGRNRPAELRRLYGVPNRRWGTAKGLLAAVSAYPPMPYDYSPADLVLANQALGSAVPIVENPTALPMFPPNDPAACYAGDACGEAGLDIQNLSQFGEGSGSRWGFVAASNASQYWVGVNEQGFSYAAYTIPQLYQGLLMLQPLPDVFSWSWGGLTADPTTGAQPREGEAVLAKFAAMGITVVVSSGDDGQFWFMGTNATDTCQQPVSPSYPAASKWVTALGAVMEARVAPGRRPELVTCMASIGGLITGGGGFGNATFGSPAWQRTAVERYVASQRHKPTWPLSSARHATNGAAWAVDCRGGGGPAAANAGQQGERCTYGRGLPDLSLVGAAIPIMAGGAPIRVYGTSATAPAFAGLVQQLNAAIRATPGLERCNLGFLNPFLYWAAERYPAAFHDVTVGNIGYGRRYPDYCGQSYDAAKGWDAATGLGVPNIAVLQRAAVDYVRRQRCWRHAR